MMCEALRRETRFHRRFIAPRHRVCRHVHKWVRSITMGTVWMSSPDRAPQYASLLGYIMKPLPTNDRWSDGGSPTLLTAAVVFWPNTQYCCLGRLFQHFRHASSAAPWLSSSTSGQSRTTAMIPSSRWVRSTCFDVLDPECLLCVFR